MSIKAANFTEFSWTFPDLRQFSREANWNLHEVKKSWDKDLVFQSLFIHFPFSEQQNDTFSFKIAGPDRNVYQWALRDVFKICICKTSIYIYFTITNFRLA